MKNKKTVKRTKKTASLGEIITTKTELIKFNFKRHKPIQIFDHMMKDYCEKVDSFSYCKQLQLLKNWIDKNHRLYHETCDGYNVK